MQEIDHLPIATSHLRPQFIAIIAILSFIVGVATFNVFDLLHPTQLSHTRTLSPLENQELASHLTSTRAPAQPEDGWVESRDGDGALDVEDVNGTATIYFDKQSRTRVLCIDNNGCYHLRGHQESSKNTSIPADLPRTQSFPSD